MKHKRITRIMFYAIYALAVFIAVLPLIELIVDPPGQCHVYDWLALMAWLVFPVTLVVVSRIVLTSRRLRLWQRGLVIVIGIAVSFVPFAYAESELFGASDYRSSHWYFDFNSGQMRKVKHVLYVCVFDRIEHTWISRALPQDMKSDERDWVCVGSRYVCVRMSSRYGGIWSQMNQCEQLMQDILFTDEARTALAVNLIEMWKHFGGTCETNRYISNLWIIAGKAEFDGTLPITDEMIPEPDLTGQSYQKVWWGDEPLSHLLLDRFKTGYA